MLVRNYGASKCTVPNHINEVWGTYADKLPAACLPEFMEYGDRENKWIRYWETASQDVINANPVSCLIPYTEADAETGPDVEIKALKVLEIHVRRLEPYAKLVLEELFQNVLDKDERAKFVADIAEIPDNIRRNRSFYEATLSLLSDTNAQNLAALLSRREYEKRMSADGTFSKRARISMA